MLHLVAASVHQPGDGLDREESGGEWRHSRVLLRLRSVRVPSPFCHAEIGAAEGGRALDTVTSDGRNKKTINEDDDGVQEMAETEVRKGRMVTGVRECAAECRPTHNRGRAGGSCPVYGVRERKVE